jgi:ABC-type branched-subunit amino acid transport system substrate-binding protein
MTSRSERARVLADVAERVALKNEFRSDDFQDVVTRMVNEARERWRDAQGDLPRWGTDPMFDALNGLAEAADSSPIAVRDAAAVALEAAQGVKAAR